MRSRIINSPVIFVTSRLNRVLYNYFNNACRAPRYRSVRTGMMERGWQKEEEEEAGEQLSNPSPVTRGTRNVWPSATNKLKSHGNAWLALDTTDNYFQFFISSHPLKRPFQSSLHVQRKKRVIYFDELSMHFVGLLVTLTKSSIPT